MLSSDPFPLLYLSESIKAMLCNTKLLFFIYLDIQSSEELLEVAITDAIQAIDAIELQPNATVEQQIEQLQAIGNVSNYMSVVHYVACTFK